MALFQRPSPEKVRQVVRLVRYTPELKLQSLVVGVDNIRHDVRLSPELKAFTAGYIYQLVLKHSGAKGLAEKPVPAPSPADRTEFKRQVQELLVAALSQARAQQNQELDLLANMALFKYLGWEIQQQYSAILLQGKNKLKLYEGPKHERNPKAFELQALFSDYQTQKKITLRLVATELQRSVNEVQADAVRKTRESFFGLEAGNWYSYFSNPLLFADGGRDDFIHLEKYVMVGNFQRDPDRFDYIEDWLRSFFKWLDQTGHEMCELAASQEKLNRLSAEMEAFKQAYLPEQKGGRSGIGKLFGGGSPSSPPQQLSPSQITERMTKLSSELNEATETVTFLTNSYETLVSDLLNAPENIDEMMGAAHTEQQIAEMRRSSADRNEIAALEEKLEIQRYVLDEFYRSAEKAGILPFIAPAYEVARIYGDFCPPINPQNLKQALMQAEERKKVADLVRHYKMPDSRLTVLEDAAARVKAARDLRAFLARFVLDYVRHHRDSRHLAVFQALLDRINVVMDEKTERLSRVNGTLYQFLMPSEDQPVERRITGHVILKADIRDSTRLTSELMARGLNPASYFSMNFYEPLNKILPRYGAEKVFIEGDAVILSLFEQEGGGGHAVALACGLAREMTEIVRLYNTKSEAGGLPRLEIGIGITWRNSAPLFLFDGEDRIMISEALNLSDRLSGCSKLARKSLPQNKSPFNVYNFQTITEEMAAGAMEEFLVRYNVYGICLSEDAFEKLRTEISFASLTLEMPVLWGKEQVLLHCGSVPISKDVFQRLVLREATVPFVDPQTFAFREQTKRRFFEVCTNRALYEYTEKLLAAGAAVPGA